MADWVVRTMESMSYWGVALFMLLENIFPPIPSEVLLPAAGFSASRGEMTFWGVGLAAIAGTVLGVLPWYYAARWLGVERLKRFADRYGRWLTLSSNEIDRADAWFDRWGKTAVFIGRLVPGVRTFISLPAGFAGMPLPQFLLYTALGTAIWSGVLIALGGWLGSNYRVVEKYVGWITVAVIASLVIAFAVWVYRRRKELGGRFERIRRRRPARG